MELRMCPTTWCNHYVNFNDIDDNGNIVSILHYWIIEYSKNTCHFVDQFYSRRKNLSNVRQDVTYAQYI